MCSYANRNDNRDLMEENGSKTGGRLSTRNVLEPFLEEEDDI